MIKENDGMLTFRPMASVMDAPNGLLLHWKDHWWIHHPEKGLVWRLGVALSDIDPTKVRGWINGRYDWADMVFMPDVFVKVKRSEL